MDPWHLNPIRSLGPASALAASLLIGVGWPGLATAQTPAPVQIWIDLEIQVFQEFMPDVPEFDGGHWTLSYRQTGPWSLVRDESGGEAVVRALGALAAGAGGAPSLSEVSGSAYEVCMDGNEDRFRTDYEPPLRVEPGTFSASSEGEHVLLWYSIPIVEIHHPGHAHIPVRSECHTTDPGRSELWLFTSDLEATGARTNDYGDLLVATVSWDDLVAASTGRRDPLRIDTLLEGLGNSFAVRGTIGGAPRSGGAAAPGPPAHGRVPDG